MNYYREMYYEYLEQKRKLIYFREFAHPKKHATALSQIHQQIAILQLKIELCDERAMIEHKKEITEKHLKQSA